MIAKQINSDAWHSTYTSSVERFAKQVLPLVGVLRCNWLSNNGSISTYTYGSAILLSPSIILTCGHNVFSQSKDARCHEVIFIPNPRGFLLENKTYFSRSHGIKVKPPSDTFKFKPIDEELALVVLSEPYQGEDVVYPTVGSINGNAENTPVRMIGYPSQYYYSILKLSDVFSYPLELKGTVVSIDNCIINHTMQTKVGCSGSPIFAQPSDGQFFICGIHTHRGLKNGYNSGLYFNCQILNKLQQYFYELVRQHRLEEQLKVNICRKDIEQISTLDQSDEESFDNSSRISCFDDILLQQEEQLNKRKNDIYFDKEDEVEEDEGKNEETSLQKYCFRDQQ